MIVQEQSGLYGPAADARAQILNLLRVHFAPALGSTPISLAFLHQKILSRCDSRMQCLGRTSQLSSNGADFSGDCDGSCDDFSAKTDGFCNGFCGRF